MGRNPYIRLVSGFLDKMVLDRGGHDWQTMQQMNTDLGRDANQPFEATAESFAEFVRLLLAAPSINQHFQSAVSVCGIGQFPYRCAPALDKGCGFPNHLCSVGMQLIACKSHQHRSLLCGQQFQLQRACNVKRTVRSLLSSHSNCEWGNCVAFTNMLAQAGSSERCQVCRYYLRIEEMEEWYPCLVDGLRLQPFTDSGWQSSNGAVQHGPEHTDCWWKPVGDTCEAYYEQTHDASGAAVPGLPTDTAPGKGQRDTHDTGSASKWQRYYTQAVADQVYDFYRQDFLAFGYERYVVANNGGDGA